MVAWLVQERPLLILVVRLYFVLTNSPFGAHINRTSTAQVEIIKTAKLFVELP